MLPLNAIDAVAPAFTRTHQTLFQPFKLGRSWKLAASSYVAILGAMFIPFPLVLVLIPRFGFPIPRTLLLLASVLPTVIFFVFFYLGVRMQSVQFEMVVTRAKFIAPMWRRYGGSRPWPWIGVKVALGLLLSALATPTLLRAARVAFAGFPGSFNGLFPNSGSAQPDPVALQAAMQSAMQQMLARFLPLYLDFFLFFLILKFFSTLLEDFALPFYILDEVSLTASLRQGWQVIAADPLQTLVYLALKFVLSLVGFIAQWIASQVALIPVAIVFGILAVLGVLIGAAAGITHGAHSGSATVGLVLGFVVFYVAILAVVLWIQSFTLGYLFTLLEAYAIYFLGGRYPKLGDYLEPPAPAPYTFTPPPVLPSKEEQDDDTGDPPLPMDPAVA